MIPQFNILLSHKLIVAAIRPVWYLEYLDCIAFSKDFLSVFSGERINFLFLLVAVLCFFVKLVCRLRLGCQKRFGTSIS